MVEELAFLFESDGRLLPGIVHPAGADAERGVLVVVGGPQYRAGSHRQFVLLARQLAATGIPVMRFDYRGMGDADGPATDFTGIQDDIQAAIGAFQQRCPGVREVVLWGLCDAASAALFYAWKDQRVGGLVLLNPWVRTETGEARAYLKHYYSRRVFSAAFWRKVVGGGLDWKASLSGLVSRLVRARAGEPALAAGRAADPPAASLPERMADGMERFPGAILYILSGNDLTAAEFRDTVSASVKWQRLMQRSNVSCVELGDADHTFSRRQWRDEVARRTGEWVHAL